MTALTIAEQAGWPHIVGHCAANGCPIEVTPARVFCDLHEIGEIDRHAAAWRTVIVAGAR